MLRLPLPSLIDQNVSCSSCGDGGGSALVMAAADTDTDADTDACTDTVIDTETINISDHKEVTPNTHSGSSIPKAVLDSRDSSIILTMSPHAIPYNIAPKFLCCANWIVAAGSSVVGCGGS